MASEKGQMTGEQREDEERKREIESKKDKKEKEKKKKKKEKSVTTDLTLFSIKKHCCGLMNKLDDPPP